MDLNAVLEGSRSWGTTARSAKLLLVAFVQFHWMWPSRTGRCDAFANYGSAHLACLGDWHWARCSPSGRSPIQHRATYYGSYVVYSCADLVVRCFVTG